MEPLLSTNKDYSMVLRVEKQREVNQAYTGMQENNAFLVKTQHGTYGKGRESCGNQIKGRGTQVPNGGRGKGRSSDKSSRFCDHYNTPGHVKETCFQLNGYREWYQ